MAENRQYAASLSSFRPSVYTTGTQPIQPYNPEWPEGIEYGSAWTTLTQPVAWAAQQAGEMWYGDEQEGAVGGTCTDHQGLLGTPGAKVSCAALNDAAAGRAPGTTPQYDPTRSDDPSIDFPDWAPDFLKDEAEVEEERLRREEEKRKRQEVMVKVGVGAGLAVAGFVLFRRYQATGKVF